jgi:hypothetical protein
MRLRLVTCLMLLLTACQSQQPAGPSDAPAAWPSFDYAGAGSPGLTVYGLDATDTRFDVVVRRAGPLARLGHDHVVSAREPEGFLLWGDDIEGARADLRIALDLLEVDDADARQRYRLDTSPNSTDIAATRRNMLEKVLGAPEWPFLTVAVTGFQRDGGAFSARAEITVRGQTSSQRLPFTVARTGAGVLITSAFTVQQTQLGLEPYQALGGALQVADALEVYLELAATPMSGQADRGRHGVP